ncbi:MAG: metalloregulator ArsR/SmtB family transcription factor [bacterium]|nr:metalloregulator ArsR/SmtB family transcription factor [bacterium]
MRAHILEVHGSESVELFKALASETRVRILELLAQGEMNINELAQALSTSQPTITKHTQLLEQIGLIRTEYKPGVQGMQKRCRLAYDRFIISFEPTDPLEDRVEEIEMPVGLYTLVNPTPTCGLANRERIIGFLDDPQSFFEPERATAQLIWMAEGFVEYVFPCTLGAGVEIRRLELLMEVCSEAPNYNNRHPSDITVWINSVEIGTWTSPGDFGGRRGRLNPTWWNDYMTQYGMLKIWSVDAEGSYVDGTPVSETTIADLMLVPHHPIVVRIGVKPDAEHVGGFNLFGRGFGNYEQDIVLRLHYLIRGRPERVAAVATQEGGESK